MTGNATFAGQTTVAPLAAPAPISAAPSPVRRIGDVLAIARTPRYRATTRSRLRGAARYTMGVVILAAVVDAIWLMPGHPGEVLRIVVANLGASGVAFAVWLALGTHRRLPVAVLVLGVLLSVDVSIGLVIGIDVEVSLMCAGYVLLLPPVVALLVPWSTRVHVAWLFAHAIFVGSISALVPAEAYAIGGPKTLMGLLVVSSAVSLLGHLANLRARVASFEQIGQIRSMNRRARRDDLRLRRLNSMLEKMARTDELTGLGNRVALHARLQTIRSRIDRQHEQFALLMLDLDHFKAVNDSRGHSAGDDVLRRVAAAAETATRASNSAYRFGGEEFIAIVGIEDVAEAGVVAERIRRAVEDLAIDHPGNPPFDRVTVSVGGCVVNHARLAEADDAWLQRADSALYEAKREGRNRSVIRPG